jgi:uncharacterized protein (DUF1697 family)
MALVVFLRGVNVGGHRTFRPSVLATELREFDVVNVGAAGTFVVRKPVSIAKFRAALLSKLPFETEVMFCDARDFLAWQPRSPFGRIAPEPNTVRFVSVLAEGKRLKRSMPISLPTADDWLLRILAARGRYVFGTYRRHMKTIGYLGQLDKVFGAPATTRNWNTIAAILALLKEEEKPSRVRRTRQRKRAVVR